MTIAAYPKYDDYRDSGIDWIVKLPSHWTSERSKFVFRQSKELARKDDIQLSATQSHGVIPQAEYEEIIGRKVTQIQTNLEKRKHVEVDDFVISMRSFQGGLERARAVGCIRSSYVILKPGPMVEPSYYAYLLKMPQYIHALQLTGNFIRDGQDLNFENFSDVDLFVPPLIEQRAIAAFLDEKCAAIDEAVRIKEEQITLLAERRQILIQQAVTRGLNPDAPMKDSGIDWIGQIPVHWEVKRLKDVSRSVKTGRTPSSSSALDYFEGGTVPWFTPGDVQDGGVFDTSEKRVTPSAISHGHVDLFPENSIFFIGIGGTLGKANISRVPASCNQQFNVIEPNEDIVPDWLLVWLNVSRDLVFNQTDYTTMPIMNQSKTKRIPLPVPPRGEQEEILRTLMEGRVKIDSSIALKQSQITALREYKTGLINAAVTGKIKVFLKEDIDVE
jgi:type I restriction enzyme, S subunit